MVQCKLCPLESFSSYRYVVTYSRYRGGILLGRHEGRSTWEAQGGHIEPGETPLQAARRELYEECGAVEYDLVPICDYWAGEGEDFSTGVAFFADIRTLGPLPDFEIEEIRTFPAPPENLTYPEIFHIGFDRIKDRF